MANLCQREVQSRGEWTHSWLEIDQYRPWYIVLVICLVEEDVLPISLTALRGPVLEVALRGDAVLGAELLPELVQPSADIPAMSVLLS